jgi:hypothetical protein
MYAISPPVIPQLAKSRTFVLLGADPAALEYFKSKNLKTTPALQDLNPSNHLILIWNPSALTNSEKQSLPQVAQFAATGGRVVVLGNKIWDLAKTIVT